MNTGSYRGRPLGDPLVRSFDVCYRYALELPQKLLSRQNYTKYIICQVANKVNKLHQNIAVFSAVSVQIEILPILSPN